MYSIRNFFLLVAFLLFLGTPNPASADLTIYAQEAGVNGGAITQLATGTDFTGVSFNGVYGDFTLTNFGAGSSNGGALSDLLSSTTRIQNNSGATATITLYASQTNYNLPPGTPLDVASGLGGTVFTGTLTGTGVFQAFADKGNTVLGALDFTNGSQTAGFNGNTFDTGTATGPFARIDGSLYSLTSAVTATVSAGGAGNFSASIVATPPTAVPEPASLVLLGTGLTLVASSVRNRMKPRA